LRTDAGYVRDRTEPGARGGDDAAMTLIIAMLAGALVGWASFSFLRVNEGRSTLSCAFIGALGGFVGAKLAAPMFFAPAVAGEIVNLPALFCAFLGASAFIAVGDWVLKRWDV